MRAVLIGPGSQQANYRRIEAHRLQHPVWAPIRASLEFFLLGHAENPRMGQLHPAFGDSFRAVVKAS